MPFYYNTIGPVHEFMHGGFPQDALWGLGQNRQSNTICCSCLPLLLISALLCLPLTCSQSILSGESYATQQYLTTRSPLSSACPEGMGGPRRDQPSRQAVRCPCHPGIWIHPAEVHTGCLESPGGTLLYHFFLAKLLGRGSGCGA